MKKLPNLRDGLIFLCVLLSFGPLSIAASNPKIPSEPTIIEEPVSVVYESPMQTVMVLPEPIETPKPWTDEEAVVLAKMLYGEARGVMSDMEKAACVWCILNRCDSYGQSIIEVTTARNQFTGYDISNPVDEGLYALCEDVLSRWYSEKNGEVDVGRVLPADYLWFHGDGQHNYFRNKYRGGTIYTWTLSNPYET